MVYFIERLSNQILSQRKRKRRRRRRRRRKGRKKSSGNKSMQFPNQDQLAMVHVIILNSIWLEFVFSSTFYSKFNKKIMVWLCGCRSSQINVFCLPNIFNWIFCWKTWQLQLLLENRLQFYIHPNRFLAFGYSEEWYFLFKR